MRWLLALVPVVFVGACSLNPQPFPPAPTDDNGDRGGGVLTAEGGADTGVQTVPPEAGADSGSDAAHDASGDASDAAIDSPELDAETDALLSSD